MATTTTGNPLLADENGKAGYGTVKKVEAAAPADIDKQAAAVEFISILLLVYFACGTACHMQTTNFQAWSLSVSLAFGLTVMILAFTFDCPQINCAVTFGLCCSNQLSWKQGFVNLIAQMFGSICGACLVLATVAGQTVGQARRDSTGGLGLNAINPRYSVGSAFVSEMMTTFLLVLVVLQVCVQKKNQDKYRNFAPIAIGFAVFMANISGIPIDGCSVNPTRSFGPAVVSAINGNTTAFKDHWVFWVGPLTGAALAAFLRGRSIEKENQE